MASPLPLPRFAIEPAVRGIRNIIIGLVGHTHAGKTCSALRLAKGMAKGEPIVLIDTEFGRPTEYAPRPGEPIPSEFVPENPLFDFKIIDLPPPYTPVNYKVAVSIAARSQPRVLIIDDITQEHFALIDMANEEPDNRHGRHWKKPREEHRALMKKLRQHPWYVILCIKAKREEIDPQTKGLWRAQCEITLPGDSTIFQLLRTGGIPNGPVEDLLHTWKIPGGLRGAISTREPLDEATGRAIANWCQPEGQWTAPEEEEGDGQATTPP